MLSATDLDRALGVLRDLELPTWHRVCTPQLLASALADTVKHRDGQQLLPLTAGIGAARFVNDIAADELDQALAVLTDDAAFTGAGGQHG